VLVRIAEPEDWPEIERMHRATGYGFELPKRETLRPLYVCTEDGQIVAAAGMQRAAQIVAVLNPDVKAPFRRLRALQSFYPEMAKDALGQGCETVFSFCDPLFRLFDRRMMKLGWDRKLWPCLFMDRQKIREYFEWSAT